MQFYIDGYNLLFSLFESKSELRKQRENFIELLQKEFGYLDLKGFIVFDGSFRRGEESGLSYPSPLEIAFTPSDQTADQYILEKIEYASHPGQITVVSNDRHLLGCARSLNARVQKNESFLKWLQRKTSKKNVKQSEKKAFQDSKRNIDRLCEIFEKRLEEG